MVTIPWPLSNAPGAEAPEGSGRLVNVFVEPRGDGTPLWKRAPGATVFARAPSSGSANLDFSALARGGQFYSTFYELIGVSSFQFEAPTTFTTVDLTYPSGTASGDFVVIQSFVHNQPHAWTAPTGYTTLVESATGEACPYSLYYKISTGEGSVSLIPPCTAGSGVTLVAAIRGVNGTNPVQNTNALTTGASGDPAPGAISITTPNSLIMCFAWMDDDNATDVTAPATCAVAAATTFGVGNVAFAVTTGSNGTAGGTIMMGFRPSATTAAAITFSTWAVTGGDDQWITANMVVRPD